VVVVNELQEIKTAQDLHAKAKEELQKLKSAESNNKKRREAVMKDMEKAVKESQKRSNALRAELVGLKNKRDAILAEIKAITQELNTVKDQQQISQSATTRMTTELDTLSAKVRLISYCAFCKCPANHVLFYCCT
jgi:chromosome segregation ATPase